MLRLVALRFEPAQGVEERDELLDSAGPVKATRRVGGGTVDGDLEGERSAAGGGDVEAGGFGDDARVGPPSPAQQRIRAEAAVLLTDDGGEQQVAGQRYAQLAQRPDRPVGSDQSGLHVAGAAAMD